MMKYTAQNTKILKSDECYKIGKKNLVTRDNDFEMAIGNSNGEMGYYCSKPQKIMFILQKSDGESTYSKLFMK